MLINKWSAQRRCVRAPSALVSGWACLSVCVRALARMYENVECKQLGLDVIYVDRSRNKFPEQSRDIAYLGVNTRIFENCRSLYKASMLR